MPHPRFHMENKGGAKVWELKLTKVLQTQICQKNEGFFLRGWVGSRL
jgi:hypothetical protein